MRRSVLALSLACILGFIAAIWTTHARSERTRERLDIATEQLDSLTDGTPPDDTRRAAIAWGYAERMRLGLDSPFRLIEASAADARLTPDERRTISWALLARVVRGETHEVDPAALDLIGPTLNGVPVPGDQHVALIDSVVNSARNPRAAELAIRMAYTLATAERIVDGTAELLAAETAALKADRELARREAIDIVRRSGGVDPIERIRRRRAERSFYVERPVLLAPDADLERDAVAMAPNILASIRGMRPLQIVAAPEDTTVVQATARFADQLFKAGALLPPASPLAVTLQRYLPILRSHGPGLDMASLRLAHNAEMLLSATRTEQPSRAQRRSMGRLLLAAGVAMRSAAQEPVAIAADTAITAVKMAAALAVSAIVFDRDVPVSWRPHLLRSLGDAVRDLRRVLPALDLATVQVRFRMTPPADSALAMHDPRTRTLHLPAFTAGGTLLHELAHELDRQSAQQQGLAGYRSDVAARAAIPGSRAPAATGRVAASLRALTEDVTNLPRLSKASAERPAEIFATQVDWFVAQALAREGVSSGFLTGVQDELFTGHVVHPERLRSSGRSRSLLDALEGMTVVTQRAREELEPSVQTLLRWSLNGPVDRRAAGRIVSEGARSWMPGLAAAGRSCEQDDTRAALVGMAADSRARGWLRQRARWMAEPQRPAWARALLHQAPWSDDAAAERIAQLRDHVLMQLVSGVELPAGLSAFAAPIAARARCV